MEKVFYKIYARQTQGREPNTNFSDNAVLQTNCIGSTGQGETGFATDADLFALIAEMTSGGIVGVEEGAMIKGEKGDNQPLADGGKPVISENILAELTSFDVTEISWSNTEDDGAAGAMPLRKRLSSNVTGKNIDIAYIDVRTIKDAAPGDYYNIFAWDVPIHIGLEVIAGAIPKHPASIDKEVSALEEELDVYKCTLT